MDPKTILITFFQSKRTLIVDPNSFYRTTLSSLLCELGIDNKKPLPIHRTSMKQLRNTAIESMISSYVNWNVAERAV